MTFIKTCHLKNVAIFVGKAAKNAIAVNPLNRLPFESYISANSENSIEKKRLSVMTQKYWRSGGVLLTVGFLIIHHLN